MTIFLRSIFVILLLAFSMNSHAAMQFTSMSDRKGADLAEIVQNIEGTDVIFIGETHDSPRQHKVQLDIIRALHAKKAPLALGLEMFTPDSQQQLDGWTEGKVDEETFKSTYARNWSYGWPLYRDLFIFARDNHIRMIALNIPKPVISSVVAKGSSALKEDEVPPKMSWALNESQTRYMRTIARQVFGSTPPENFVARLCQAQALRNAGMAWNIAKYRKSHPANKMVVLAGVWHAVKNGVPEQIAQYDKPACKVILPELPEFNLENATASEADYLIMK